MIKYTTLVCPGAGAETSVYRLQLQLRLQPKVSAPALEPWLYPSIPPFAQLNLFIYNVFQAIKAYYLPLAHCP
jgi:hypothetical protein